MTTFHTSTLIAEARRARDYVHDHPHGGNSVRDMFCAQLVGYVRAYDIRIADELALALEMPELTEAALRKKYPIEEKQA